MLMVPALEAGAMGLHISRARPAWPRPDPIGPTTMLSRRQALSTAGKFVSALAVVECCAERAAAAPRTGSRVAYGACVRRDQLDTELDYRATLLTHCQQVTPEGGLYWYDLRPTRQQFKFD